MDKALEAVAGQPAVARHVRRAVALARFEAHEDGGPFRHAPLSRGRSAAAAAPMFPVPVHAALETLQHQLVWAADCAEYSDATNNARQYLQAAGHVDLAARALLGPDGLEQWPPVLVRDLAAATGLDLSTLVPAMGMLPPNGAGVSASFAWDMHHENPVSDPDDLGRRELISWSAGMRSFAPPKRPPPPPLGDRLERVTTPDELAASRRSTRWSWRTRSVRRTRSRGRSTCT